MKALYTFLVLLLSGSAVMLQAQETPQKCNDILFLRGGSVLHGKITEYNAEGNIAFTTWAGAQLTIPSGNVIRIKQRCRDGRRQARLYDFKERGLYNATRLGTLIGQNYFGDNAVGYSIGHSIGWMFRRQIGAGISGGVEIFNPDDREPVTYPLLVELRGYLLPRNTTPFYSISGGWAFTGKDPAPLWRNNNDSWDGGWCAKLQIGYRLGNHFTVFGGLGFQEKNRTWTSFWGDESGRDRILHKRMELGIGLVL